jgi:hypothetical protein
MVDILIVLGAIALVVGVLLAIDWFTAGHVTGKMPIRARDALNSGADGAQSAVAERSAHNSKGLPT